jgi:hypothetical protein
MEISFHCVRLMRTSSLQCPRAQKSRWLPGTDTALDATALMYKLVLRIVGLHGDSKSRSLEHQITSIIVQLSLLGRIVFLDQSSACHRRTRISSSSQSSDSSDETRRQNHLYLSILPRSYYGWIRKFHVTPHYSEATLNTPNTTGKFPNKPLTFSSLPAWWW